MAFILHSFLFLYRKKKKIRQGKLVTAVPLPEETLNELKALILKRYRGRTVEFNTKVDPDIIGGGILEIGYWNRRQHSRTVETREETVHREKQKNRIMKRKQEYAR